MEKQPQAPQADIDVPAASARAPPPPGGWPNTASSNVGTTAASNVSAGSDGGMPKAGEAGAGAAGGGAAGGGAGPKKAAVLPMFPGQQVPTDSATVEAQAWTTINRAQPLIEQWVVAGTAKDKKNWVQSLSKEDQAIFEASCGAMRLLYKDSGSQQGDDDANARKHLQTVRTRMTYVEY